jgi:NDP-sugar pyrophosphorylase family protein
MLPVAILAGGLATRLRPVTETIPKALVEIAGEPFLAHQLRLLASRGIRRVTMCTGYRAEMIEEYAGDGSRFGVALTYSSDGPDLRGTAGAIANALPLLGDRFFVLYGDSYLPCDYAAVEQSFEEQGKPALMTVYQNRGNWDTSNVWFEDGRILAYDKINRTPRMAHIDYGLGVFDGSAFSGPRPQGAWDLANLYRDFLAAGRLAAHEVPERFYEAGSFHGIEELGRYLEMQKEHGR